MFPCVASPQMSNEINIVQRVWDQSIKQTNETLGLFVCVYQCSRLPQWRPHIPLAKPRAQSALPTKLVYLLVALAEALGFSCVVIPAIRSLSTRGPMASRIANVSCAWLMCTDANIRRCIEVDLLCWCARARVCYQCPQIPYIMANTQRQLRLSQAQPRAQSVLPTKPAYSLVALAEALGFASAVIPVSRSLSTRGPTASRNVNVSCV